MEKEIPSTCEQILHLIIERGPITPGELAKLLVLTPAAVRRHISVLVRDGHIEVYEGHNHRRKDRGRPSRRYVATTRGQAQLEEGYADMATEALRFINKRLGEKGVNEFIEQQVASIEERYGLESEIIAASIRTNKHLEEAAIAGAHIATIPGTLFEKMWTHPLTTQGIENFKKDWDSFIEKTK